MNSHLDFEYNRLIEELSELNRLIAAYRMRKKPSDGLAWHDELDPVIDRHRAVVHRLREIAKLRGTKKS